jgi:hypothetical protein
VLLYSILFKIFQLQWLHCYKMYHYEILCNTSVHVLKEDCVAHTEECLHKGESTKSNKLY